MLRSTSLAFVFCIVPIWALNGPQNISNVELNTSVAFSSINANMDEQNFCYFIVQDTVIVVYWPDYVSANVSSASPLIVTSVTRYVDTAVTNIETSQVVKYSLTDAADNLYLLQSMTQDAQHPDSASSSLPTRLQSLNGITATVFGSIITPPGYPAAVYAYTSVNVIHVPAVKGPGGQSQCTTSSELYLGGSEECFTVGYIADANEIVHHYWSQYGKSKTPESVSRLMRTPITFSAPFLYTPSWVSINDGRLVPVTSINSASESGSFTRSVLPHVSGGDYGYVPKELIAFLAENSRYHASIPDLGSCLPGGPQTGYPFQAAGCPLPGPGMAETVQDLTSSTAITVTGIGCFHPGACPTPSNPSSTSSPMTSRSAVGFSQPTPSPAAIPPMVAKSHSKPASLSPPTAQDPLPSSSQSAAKLSPSLFRGPSSEPGRTVSPASTWSTHAPDIASLIFAPFQAHGILEANHREPTNPKGADFAAAQGANAWPTTTKTRSITTASISDHFKVPTLIQANPLNANPPQRESNPSHQPPTPHPSQTLPPLVIDTQTVTANSASEYVLSGHTLASAFVGGVIPTLSALDSSATILPASPPPSLATADGQIVAPSPKKVSPITLSASALRSPITVDGKVITPSPDDSSPVALQAPAPPSPPIPHGPITTPSLLWISLAGTIISAGSMSIVVPGTVVTLAPSEVANVSVENGSVASGTKHGTIGGSGYAFTGDAKGMEMWRAFWVLIVASVGFTFI